MKNTPHSSKQRSREEKEEPTKKKDRNVVICPFSQMDTNFIVESAEHLTPSPLDMYEDWESDTYKPLAARWLAAGLSSQDMPGILRSGLRRLRSSRHFLVEQEATRLGPEMLLKQKALDNTERHKLVYAAEPESLQAQHEVLELFVSYLPKRYLDWYKYDSDLKSITVHTPVIVETFRLDDRMETRPELCEGIVQEDLILMRPAPTDQTNVASTEQSHFIAAAAVVFSFNELPEKLDKLAEFIHASVPGFEKHIRKTLNHTLSSLKPEMPMWRNNWGIAPEGSTLDETLYGSTTAHEHRSFTNLSVEEVKQKVLKGEFRRLPRTGCILFTVKIMADVVQSLENCPSTAVGCLTASTRGMSPAMQRYKEIEDDATCQAVISYLDSIVGPR